MEPDWLTSTIVAAATCVPDYPTSAPFHPSDAYPEAPFPDREPARPNHAYRAVRQALRLLGLDCERFGTPAWNPLGRLVSPGDTVALKPNLIRESHASRDEWEQVITHGSVVRAVLDFVFIALQGRGRVIVADGPQTDSDFDAVRRRTGLDHVAGYITRHGLPVELLDLRRDRWFQDGEIIARRESLPGDPAGYATIDLGGQSAFASHALSGAFYGADYDAVETAAFHEGGRHAYVLCRSVLDADVVINLPKMKTHKKTGVTLSLKNLVGINGYRNCLPHYTLGTPREGGDEFPFTDIAHRLQGRAIRAFKQRLVAQGGTGGRWARAIKRVGRGVFGATDQVIRSGNWHGNDTAWRMVLDLNRAFFHFDVSGARRARPVKYMTLVDGILGGDGNGPSSPDAVRSGLVVAGANPVAVDTVCAALMGLDYRRIALLREAWASTTLRLVSGCADDIDCRSDRVEWNGPFARVLEGPHCGYRVPLGWTGAIERDGAAARGSAPTR